MAREDTGHPQGGTALGTASRQAGHSQRDRPGPASPAVPALAQSESGRTPTTPARRPQAEGGAQAVHRVLQLLELIAQSDHPLPLAELTDLTRLNRTTVWRLVSQLESAGFIEREPLSRGYVVGYATTRLAEAAERRFGPLIRAAHPAMLHLRELTGETIILSAARGWGVMTIEQLDSPHAIRLRDYRNQIDPLYASSPGKVLLAGYPPTELESLLTWPRAAVTPTTIIDADALRAEIDHVRQQGFAMVLDELSEGEHGVAAPIWLGNHLVGSLNISGPSFRLTETMMRGYVPALQAACADVAARLTPHCQSGDSQ